jgi:hypothetical protein
MSAALLPDTFQTARLQARRMDETDFSFIAAMHADERLMATMGGTRTDSASRRYLLQNVEHWAELGYGMYVLADRASGALAGRAGLKRTQSRGCDEVEVAYAFRRCCRWDSGACRSRRCRPWRWKRMPRPAGCWKNAACARSAGRERAALASVATKSAAPNGRCQRRTRRLAPGFGAKIRV